MFYAKSRRALLPLFAFLGVLLIYRSVWATVWAIYGGKTGTVTGRRNSNTRNHQNASSSVSSPALHANDDWRLPNPIDHPYLESLLVCRLTPNPYTLHIRIANLVQNISQAPGVYHFNPTIIALPYWSENQYLLVSRVVTEGLHQESLLCEANICVNGVAGIRHEGEKYCTADSGLGQTGGLQCAHPPVVVDLPPTPAEQCDGPWSAFPDIPGFHDPRIFWSGRGEPLIIVNSASQYSCLGLWIADLRIVYDPLKSILTSQPNHSSPGPPILYPQLTELTRNPASSRSPVEKNWFLFFPTPSTSYIHYDLSPPFLPPPFKSTDRGRTFAKLLPRDGHTTLNLTSSLEESCLFNEPDPRGEPGHWHQATNSLKLILCHRSEAATGRCSADDPHRNVHFAIIHRKFSNVWDLPLRYERYFVVWDARPPFQMLAVSRYPVLFYNETASGWSGNENWAVEMQDELQASLNSDRGRGHKMHGQVWQRRGFGNGTITTAHVETVNDTSATTQGIGQVVEDAWLQKNKIYGHERSNWAYFTYTPSIAWAWRSHQQQQQQQSTDNGNEDPLESLNVGYLDDEVILGIGLDDTAQGFGRAKAETLLQCMRPCPGMGGEGKGFGGQGGDGEGEDGYVAENGTEKEQERGGRVSDEWERLRYRHEDELIRTDTENRDLLAQV